MCTMRRKFSPCLVASLLLWAIISYLLIIYQSTDINDQQDKYTSQLNKLENEIKILLATNNELLQNIDIKNINSNLKVINFPLKGDFMNNNDAEKNSTSDWISKENLKKKYEIRPFYEKKTENTFNANRKPVIAVLVISCNRITVSKCLEQLINFRPNKHQFPIIVSQDCNHTETSEVIKKYTNVISHIKQPDQKEVETPPDEKKFSGYFKIARHYGWALNQTFFKFGYETVIIVEDDLDIASDFFEYFLGTYPILKADHTLWCVSAWNDNGKSNLIDVNNPGLLYRTDFFPGLGWMLTKDVWKELAPKWPKSYWDDWIRRPEQRQNRSCIRPEISRTRTFGKFGVSNGLFYDKHLQFIELNKRFVPFTNINLTNLTKEIYDSTFLIKVYTSPEITCSDLKTNKTISSGTVRITYHDLKSYKECAKRFQLMDDFKSGVPRTGYRGIVTFYFEGRRVYLAPSYNWSGYDTKWS